MTGLILVALLAQAEVAPTVDAPVTVVKRGQLVPTDGVLLSDIRAVEQAKRVIGCEAERDELRKLPSTVVVVLLVVGALVVGGATGFGVAKLAK